MKKISLLPGTTTLVLLGCLALFNSGCGKKEVPPGTSSQPGSATAVVPAEKTSFAEVTSQLDPGGNFFLYLGTAQWLDHLSTKVENYRQTSPVCPISLRTTPPTSTRPLTS